MISPFVYKLKLTGAGVEKYNGDYIRDSGENTAFINNQNGCSITKPSIISPIWVLKDPNFPGNHKTIYITQSDFEYWDVNVLIPIGPIVPGDPPSSQIFWKNKNLIKGDGGTGKLILKSTDRDALEYIKLIESLTHPNVPITEDGKNKIDNFIKQIKKVIPWNNFTAWTFIRGQNAFSFLDFTNNKFNGIIQTFGGLGQGQIIFANSSVSSANEGISFSNPGGILSVSPSSFFTSVKSIFGVFKPTDNFYFNNIIDQSIFGVGGGSGPITHTYASLYYRFQAVYSRITRNSMNNIQTNNTAVFNLNYYKSLGVVFDSNSTSNYSNGIKQFTASSLAAPNPSLPVNGVGIGGGVVGSGTIPFVFISNLVLTDAQMLSIHNIYKSTLGADLINSQL